MNTTQKPDIGITRRHFIKRLTKTGISVAAAASLGYLLYDPIGPKGTFDIPIVTVPDFSMPEIGKKMVIVHHTSRKEAINMIEVDAKEVDEQTMANAVTEAHKVVAQMC